MNQPTNPHLLYEVEKKCIKDRKKNLQYEIGYKNIWYDGEENLTSWWRHWVYKYQILNRNCLTKTYGAVDKMFSLQVLLSEIIWRLRVQS